MGVYLMLECNVFAWIGCWNVVYGCVLDVGMQCICMDLMLECSLWVCIRCWNAMYLHGFDVGMQSTGVYLMLGCNAFAWT